MLDLFKEYGHKEIDTARVYGGGSSEEYLGQLDWQGRGLVMETKFAPHGGRASGIKRSHSPEDLRKFLLESLAALKTDKVWMWYLHSPDRSTPYEVTFKAIDELHKEGYFERLGISNYMSWEVAQINELCIKNGWIRPSVYQGVYNAIHRAVEPELFPCLRHYGMGFYAFNPLAGGYLTSRYQREATKVEEWSRFDPNTNQGRNYRNRYWNENAFAALELIREAAKPHQLTEVEIALRWTVHHSQLSADLGDTIIIGASSVAQLKENLDGFEKGPLPDDVVEALDKAWALVKGTTRNYFH